MSTIVLSDADKEKIEKIEKLENEIKELEKSKQSTKDLGYSLANNIELNLLSNIISEKQSAINRIKGIIKEDTLDKINNNTHDGGYRKISRKSTKSVRRSSKGSRRSSKGSRRSSKGTRRSIARKSAKKRKSLRRR